MSGGDDGRWLEKMIAIMLEIKAMRWNLQKVICNDIFFQDVMMRLRLRFFIFSNALSVATKMFLIVGLLHPRPLYDNSFYTEPFL